MQLPHPTVLNPFCFWRSWILLLAPLLAGLVFLNDAVEDAGPMRCAYVLIVMAVYWVFEVLPVPVTAFIPVFAFPLLGIMSTVRVFVHIFMSRTDASFFYELETGTCV
jgi:di/tricarboxylate transporter